MKEKPSETVQFWVLFANLLIEIFCLGSAVLMTVRGEYLLAIGLWGLQELSVISLRLRRIMEDW